MNRTEQAAKRQKEIIQCYYMGFVYYYNILGWKKTEKTPMGFTTTFYYDKCGRLIKKTYSNGTSERYIYDKLGNLTQSILPVQYSAVTDASTYTGENIINVSGSISSTVGTRYTYNAAGKILTVTDPSPLNYVTKYEYDTYGNITKETLPNGLAYTFVYDKLDRMTTKNYLDGSTAVALEGYGYPAQTNGEVKRTVTRYFSSSDTAVTTSVYNYAGRLLRAEYPDGGKEINTYLPNGLLASSSDAMESYAYYEYNPMNQMTKRWTPHDGNLFSLTEWQYDNAGRVTQENSYAAPLAKGGVPAGSAVTNSYVYNIDSAVHIITHNGSGKTTYLYNNAGLVSRETKLLSSSQVKRTDFTYNYLGKVATEIRYQEQHTLDGKPDNLTPFGITTSYVYDSNGNLTKVTYPNGAVLDYEYDAMNRQTAAKRAALNENGATVNVQKKTTWNNVGKILTEVDEKSNTTTYTYDVRGFLTRVAMPNNAITAFENDRQGRKIKEYSPRALLTDEPGHVVTPPSGSNNWANPSSYTAVNYTNYAYDKMDRLLKKTEFYRPTYTSAVRSFVSETNTWNKRGDLLTSTDALNNKTTYTYGNSGRLLTQKNALNQVTSYEYDGLGRPVKKTDAKNVVTMNTYDLFGNMTGQSVAGQSVMTATYDYLGNKTKETDANGNTTVYSYTSANQLRLVTNAAKYSMRYWYDVMGNVTRSLDSLDAEKLSVFDAWGNLLSETRRVSGGAQTISRSMSYDVAGNPVYMTDERGYKTTYSYDKLNRVISVKNPLNQTSTKTYDANGNAVTEANWRGNATTYDYDILNRLISVKDPNGVVAETLTYTDTHKQATSTDALGNVTAFTYDALGRLIATTDAEGYTTSQSYDPVGNVITKTNGNDQTTVYQHDNRNNLIGVFDANGNAATYAYDLVGNMSSQTDGNGNITRYEYNNLNLPVLRSDPGGIDAGGVVLDETRIERFTYFPDGKLKSRRDKNGVITEYTYDIHSRKTQEDTGGAVTAYTYDAAGNQLSVSDASGSTARTYDALSRVLTKTSIINTSNIPTNTETLAFVYDITAGLSAGFVGESTTIDGRITTRVYDKVGRLAQVKDGSDITSYEYYVNGSLKKQTLPIGVTSEYTHYANNRLDTLQNKNGSQILEAYKYAYDGVGNITAKQDVKGLTVYEYTNVSQLSTVSEPSAKLTEYEYDGAGNRLTELFTSSKQSNLTIYTVNEQNRLELTVKQYGYVSTWSEGAVLNPNLDTLIQRFTYDDSGNVLARLPEFLADASSSGGGSGSGGSSGGGGSGSGGGGGGGGSSGSSGNGSFLILPSLLGDSLISTFDLTP